MLVLDGLIITKGGGGRGRGESAVKCLKGGDETFLSGWVVVREGAGWAWADQPHTPPTHSQEYTSQNNTSGHLTHVHHTTTHTPAAFPLPLASPSPLNHFLILFYRWFKKKKQEKCLSF